MNKYRISSFVPWKDIYYYNCLYTPLMSAVQHCGGDIFPFLVNDFFYYSTNCKDPIFRISCDLIKLDSDAVIMNNAGLDIVPITCFSISLLKEILNNDVPIMTQVDRFFWCDESNMDFYKKKHMSHALLIYGYADNTFFAIDADSQSGINQRQISFDDLYQICAGFLEWNPEHILPGAFYIKRICQKNYDRDYYEALLLQRLRAVAPQMQVATNSILKAIEYYRNELSSPMDFLKGGELFFSSMSFKRLETAKKMEKYRLAQFNLIDQTLEHSLNLSYSYLNIIKGTLMKSVIKECYDVEIFKKLSFYLENLYETENLYLQQLMNLKSR